MMKIVEGMSKDEILEKITNGITIAGNLSCCMPRVSYI